jgi:hypothetical protein
VAAETELAQAHQEIATHRVRLVELETERAAILTELEQRERVRIERIAETVAAETALRTEVAALNHQLSEARDRMSRAEVNGEMIRRTLVQADEQARRIAAQVISARDEASALRAQLGASRDVAARLVAAFRSDACSALPQLVIRHGWWKLRLLRVRSALFGSI